MGSVKRMLVLAPLLSGVFLMGSSRPAAAQPGPEPLWHMAIATQVPVGAFRRPRSAPPSNVTIMPSGMPYKFYFDLYAKDKPTMTLEECLKSQEGTLENKRPQVDKMFDVPSNHQLALEVYAQGVQLYKCEKGRWSFYGPAANLFCRKNGALIGKHLTQGNDDLLKLSGGRPIWRFLTATNNAKALYFIKDNPVVILPSPGNSSRVKNIDWLKIAALKDEKLKNSGFSSPFSFVQRIFTEGGASWSARENPVCEDGQTQASRYSTSYLFYKEGS